MSCFKRKVSWFLVGVGVGTVVSLLFAPASGEDLQERVASSALESVENVKERTRQAAETLGGFADRGREKINDAVNVGHDVVKEASSQWKDYVDRGHDVISEQAEKL